MSRNANSRAMPPVPRARNSRAGGRGGTLLGVFIGLVLGLGLAAGVAYYVAKANSPYTAQPAKDMRESAREPSREPGKTAKADAAAAEKPRFDFYKILPGGEEPKVQVDRKPAPDRAVVDQSREKDAERAQAKVASADPAAKSAKPAERYWLQAGSFSAESDAENLKAQLALSGWEAGVQQGTMPDKAVRYRVRLGPYDNTDELTRIKNDLSKKGFDVAVIKF
jgi:cell division protein FtsN